jgi:hypothetical protein
LLAALLLLTRLTGLSGLIGLAAVLAGLATLLTILSAGLSRLLIGPTRLLALSRLTGLPTLLGLSTLTALLALLFRIVCHDYLSSCKGRDLTRASTDFNISALVAAWDPEVGNKSAIAIGSTHKTDSRDLP